MYELITIVLALAALLISLLSWYTATKANIAATIDRRYDIYSAAENFLGIWLRNGYPDLAALNDLIAAWTRSHFLCRPEVTDYLRTLWIDAVRANELHEIIQGNVPDNKAEAIRAAKDLLLKHVDYKKLREVMTPDLPVSGHWRRKLQFPKKNSNEKS